MKIQITAAALGVSLAFATVGLGLAALGAPAAAQQAGEAGSRLGETIRRALRAEGPFFTPEERAVIERACGYSPGSWDGYEANFSDGVLICRDGRRADSQEVRAVVAAAGPRIRRRVQAVMNSPEVRSALEEVTRTARAEALRGIDSARIAREAGARAEAQVEEALARAEEAIERARRMRD